MATREEQLAIVDNNYQDFFNAPLGPKVLGDMLDEAGFLNVAENDQQQAEQDCMKLLLARIGIGSGYGGERYVRALLRRKIEASEDDDGGDQ